MRMAIRQEEAANFGAFSCPPQLPLEFVHLCSPLQVGWDPVPALRSPHSLTHSFLT